MKFLWTVAVLMSVRHLILRAGVAEKDMTGSGVLSPIRTHIVSVKH